MSLLAILGLAFASLTFSLFVEPILDDDSAELILTGVLVLIAVQEVAVFRFQVMPKVAEMNETPARSVRGLAAAASVAITVYGVVLAVMYGSTIAAAGFTVGGLVAWQVFRSYAATLPESKPEERPRPRWGE